MPHSPPDRPAAPPGSDPGTGLAPFMTFHDVLADRSPDRDTPGVLWPAFESQTGARLWRRGRAVCTPPQIDARDPEIVADPAVFVSMYDNHFGHMVSETVSRLPQSLAEAPGLPLVFTAGRQMDASQVSGMFRAVIDWLGFPPERLRFVHRPTLFRTLHVAAQAEYLDGPAPPPAYLDLLETITAPRLGRHRPEHITFVSRARLPAEKGYHAAERYLVSCLSELGVRVIYPEALPLPEQMAIYAQSRHLVFSEGSAIHGRQLIGRVDQEITILRRRFRSNIARHQMEPRCNALHYAPCFGGSLYVTDAEGRRILHAMASLYNVEPLLAHFESLGVPLRRVWDMPTYLRLRDQDVLLWIHRMYSDDIAPWLKPHNTHEALLDQLSALGLAHLRPQAKALMEGGSTEAPPPASPVVAVPRPASPGAPALPDPGDDMPDIAVQGETGVDIFARLHRGGADQAGYRCIATVTPDGVQLHETVPGRDDGTARAAAQATAADPRLAETFTLADPAGWPRGAAGGDPLRMLQHFELFTAWQAADNRAHATLRAFDGGSTALLDAPPALVAETRLLCDFNRIALGCALARRVLPVLAQGLTEGRWPDPQKNQIGYAMRMLGDLCGRGGDHALALACHDTGVRASDNAFRRQRAIAAAQAAGDAPALARHCAALAARHG